MKHKEKQKHLEGRHFIKTARRSTGPCNIQEDTPQGQTSVEAPARNQAAGEIAFSKPFICVFSPPKHPCLEKDAKLNSGDALQRRHKAEAPTQRHKTSKVSFSANFPSTSSKDNQNDAGPCNTQDQTPLPRSPLEAPASGEAEGRKSASGGPINVICSPSKRRLEIRLCRITRRDEDGCRISQGNVHQPKSPVGTPACSPAAGEKSSFSQHPISVSTPSKRTRLDEDEIKEKPVSQDSEQKENSSDYSHTYFPSHTPNHNEPFMSPVHGTDVRPMKIYYMHVQLKRGVAVLFHTKEGWEPPSKKIKMEEMTYIGKIHKNVPVSHMSEKKHLTVHEPVLDSGAQENREEADSPAQPPPQGGYPSAKTPEWLVALDSGFRCMACCRVFPNLEILQYHVEYGVREGFSCHVFHNAISHLKFKARKRRRKEKKERALFRR